MSCGHQTATPVANARQTQIAHSNNNNNTKAHQKTLSLLYTHLPVLSVGSRWAHLDRSQGALVVPAVETTSEVQLAARGVEKKWGQIHAYVHTQTEGQVVCAWKEVQH